MSSETGPKKAAWELAAEVASEPAYTTPIPEPHVVAGERNILVTSALPYVNNVPHLGNIIGCVLSADVYARYQRGTGANVMFVCGTDEYGTTTEQRAMQEHLTPAEICAKYYAIHKRVYRWFDIEFNHFYRTSTEQQTAITHEIYRELDRHGYISEDSVEQHFCAKCNCFLADRFVEGTCPICGAEGARGDQCDACQKIYNAVELKNPHCKTCGSVPEIRTSRHLFIDLPKLAPKLQAYVDRAATGERWTQNSVTVARSWLKDLRKRCITRDLKWGTPVPRAGYENKVFYVWFDAPIGYLSITAHYTPNWRDWWMPKDPEKEKVRLVQFMGKDNLPFHTIIFPATLLGTEQPWTMMDSISTTEYLNYENMKFSKSRGTGVFGDDAINSGINSEVWRYYLLINRPENADSMFTWADLGDKNNNELLKNLGNFVLRGLTFLKNTFDGRIPAPLAPEQLTDLETAAIADVDRALAQYHRELEAIRIKDGLKSVMEVSRLGNKYMQDSAPWVVAKTDRARCEHIMCFIVNLIKIVADIAEPYMPGFTRKVREQMNLPVPAGDVVPLPRAFAFALPAGHVIGTPAPIFRKLDAAELQAFAKKFGGANAAAKKLGLDLRVGTITAVEAHPNAEKCYVLTVAFGAGATRTIVSGIRERYTAEQLLGTQAVFVLNLKPSNLHGVVSEGMALTGEPTADKKFSLVRPAPPVPDGARVLGEDIVFDDTGKPIDLKTFQKAKLVIANGALTWDKVALAVVDPKDPKAFLCNLTAEGVTKGKVK